MSRERDRDSSVSTALLKQACASILSAALAEWWEALSAVLAEQRSHEYTFPNIYICYNYVLSQLNFEIEIS